MSYGHAWGEHRVYFHDTKGRVVALPASCPDAVSPDPFVAVAAGRSGFQLEDLVKLSDSVLRLVNVMTLGPESGVTVPVTAAPVVVITPGRQPVGGRGPRCRCRHVRAR